ncbi:hypothetical protein Tco_0983911 [Tanacetum coccineum]
MENKKNMSVTNVDNMPILDEVVFKIHKNSYFEFDPLRYVNGIISSVSAFSCDRDIFPTCLDWILLQIIENKWALFYCLPNKSLEQGLKLIRTDNDVHSFFVDAESNGKIHLYIAHKKQELGRYYFRNMVWLEEDVVLRCLSSTPFSTMIKRKCGNTSKEGRKKKVNSEMVDAIIHGKAKMVEVEDVGLFQEKADVGKKEGVERKELFEWAEQQAGTPYLRIPPLKPRRKGIEFPCLSVDGYIDVVGSSKCCDLVHERVGYNGHSLPNMDKECFLNDVVLDVVVPEKKCRSKVSVTRKRMSWKKSLRKGHRKRVGCGAKNRRCGSLSGLNVQEGDDDQQVTTQEEKIAGDDDPQVNNKVSVHV